MAYQPRLCCCRRTFEAVMWEDCPLCQDEARVYRERFACDRSSVYRKRNDSVPGGIYTALDTLSSVLENQYGIEVLHDGGGCGYRFKGRRGLGYFIAYACGWTPKWSDCVDWDHALEWVPAPCRALLEAHAALYPTYLHMNRIMG